MVPVKLSLKERKRLLIESNAFLRITHNRNTWVPHYSCADIEEPRHGESRCMGEAVTFANVRNDWDTRAA